MRALFGAYQKGNHGGRLRAALKEMCGTHTIPQVFVGGEPTQAAEAPGQALR